MTRESCLTHVLLQVQYAAYVTVGGITSVMKLMFAGLFFLFFVKFGIGRQLLIKVSDVLMKLDPKVFSMSVKTFH